MSTGALQDLIDRLEKAEEGSRRSVPNLAAVEALDIDEIIEGYRDGRAGEPEPGGNRSDGYWHGWRNGAADSGRRAIDREQQLIVKEYLAAQRARA